MSSGVDGITGIGAIPSSAGERRPMAPTRAYTPAPFARSGVDSGNGAVGSRVADGSEFALQQSATLLHEQAENEEANLVFQTVSETNERMFMENRSLRFRIDPDSDEIQIQIVDEERGRVIRSIPPDEMIALARRMRELSGIGAMVDQSR